MELNLAQPLSSVSVIFIVRDDPLDLAVTERLLGVLGAAFVDIESRLPRDSPTARCFF
jgi:hypothetical protein